ncbi:6-phospho-3-hexuloisomerase [Companilactobacillus paralimentarius]|uniref:6-phospho-3-hexuloisomerase n=1 Tax=Companilactobacillus paralimentarius TaxID=83526 RepID=UPI00385090C6
MSELNDIFDELIQVKNNFNTEFSKDLIERIINSKRIFLTGAGRSGLMIKAFANRLLHLGLNVSVIGEITCPRIQPGDLLIIESGSGETKTLVEQAKVAIISESKIALITTNNDSTLAKLANIIVEIPTQSKDSQDESIQPMGATFEQMSLLFCDSLVLQLMKALNQSKPMLKKRHTNLE